MKKQQVLSSLSLNDVGIYLRDGPLNSDIGIVNLHPFRGTQWILYIHDCYFDSYGWSPPQKLSKFNIKRNVQFSYSENKMQGLTSKRDKYILNLLFWIYTTKRYNNNDVFFRLNYITKNNYW